MGSRRYIVMKKSASAHGCCFEATVMDTARPTGYSDEYGPHYETVCECFTIADADLIAAALNRPWSNRVRPS